MYPLKKFKSRADCPHLPFVIMKKKAYYLMSVGMKVEEGYIPKNKSIGLGSLWL